METLGDLAKVPLDHPAVLVVVLALLVMGLRSLGHIIVEVAKAVKRNGNGNGDHERQLILLREIRDGVNRLHSELIQARVTSGPGETRAGEP